MNEIAEKDKFNLDPGIFRTMEERVDMVSDPECPDEVLEIVAEHDKDQNVLEAIFFREKISKKTREILTKRITGDIAELEKVKIIKTDASLSASERAFCSIPWNHISTNADGSIRMCCQMIQGDIEPAHGTLFKADGTYYTGKDPVDDYRNHPELKKIRKEMLEGIDPPICKLCTQEENNGISSRRTGSKQRYPNIFHKALTHTQADGTINLDDFPLTYIDLRFGNKCNLKCRSCGPTDSNLWYSDFYELTKINKMPLGEFKYREHETMKIEKHEDGTFDVSSMIDWWEDSGLWNYITDNISTIDRYYFTGGEPTINQKHRELLDLIIDSGHADKVNLEYNTNMAGIPSKVFSQWKHFKGVYIGMSIDGIYEHFEYIRHPGKWATCERNMRRIDTEEGFERVHAGVALTLSIYNVLHVLDMIWWYKEQNFTRLQDWIIVHNLYGPRHLNIQNLPITVKQYIDRRYNQFISDIHKRWRDEEDRYWCRKQVMSLRSILLHMWGKDPDPDEWRRFHEWTGKMDGIRSESFADICPELQKVFDEARAKETRARSATLKSAGKK